MTKIIYYFNYLKTKWDIRSNFDLILIFVVFAITGSASLKVSHFVGELIGISSSTHLALKVLFWILVLFPIYQGLLLIVAFIFGQFSFFWKKEKMMFSRVGKLFKRA